MCLTLVAVLGLVARVSGRVQFRQQQLLDLVRERLGPWFTDQLQLILLGVRNEAIVGGPVGLSPWPVACLAIFVQLQSMFDAFWKPADGHEPNWLRTIWTVVRQRLIAFLMLLAVGGLLLRCSPPTWFWRAAKVLRGGGNRRPHGLADHAVALGHRRQCGVDDRRVQGDSPRAVRWRDALCGGLLVAVTWQIGQHFLALFVISDRYSVYGVVGAFIAVMVWFYYAGAVFFLGAEIVRALDPNNHESK